MNKATNSVNLTKIANQTYLVIPDGFKIDKMLIPGPALSP
jgi:hypothetical protein